MITESQKIFNGYFSGESKEYHTELSQQLIFVLSHLEEDGLKRLLSFVTKFKQVPRWCHWVHIYLLLYWDPLPSTIVHLSHFSIKKSWTAHTESLIMDELSAAKFGWSRVQEICRTHHLLGLWPWFSSFFLKPNYVCCLGVWDRSCGDKRKRPAPCWWRSPNVEPQHPLSFQSVYLTFHWP